MAAWSITPFSSPLSRVRPPPGANPRHNHHIQDNHQPTTRPRAHLSGSVQLKNQHIVLCPPATLQNLNPILGSLEKERHWLGKRGSGAEFDVSNWPPGGGCLVLGSEGGFSIDSSTSTAPRCPPGGRRRSTVDACGAQPGRRLIKVRERVIASVDLWKLS